MKVCVVGCGQAAEYHLADWKRLPFEEILFVDKSIYKAQSYRDFFLKYGGTNAARADCADSVPDEKFDLGIICTLAGAHRELAEKFIRNGTPVFVEKPIALSWEDLDWFEQQEKDGAWITTGFQIRWQPAVCLVLDFARNHGPVIHAQCWKHRKRSAEYYHPLIGRGTWRNDGGVIAQQAVHCVDLICALIPEDPVAVSMFGFKFKHSTIECEDTAFMTLFWPDKTAAVNGTTAMPKDGDAGLRVATPNGVVSAIGGAFGQLIEWPENMEVPDPQSISRLDMWTDVVARIQEGRPSPLPAREAVRSMRIVHAGYQSMMTDGEFVPYGVDFDLLGR